MAGIEDLTYLVVDDYRSMRDLICSLLQSLGVKHIHQAENGLEGIKVLEQHKIDFIVTDWNMPKMTGIDFIKEVKKRDAFSHVCILLVTAEAKKEQVLEAAQAGVDGYILKPFTAQTLCEKMKKILEKKAGH